MRARIQKWGNSLALRIPKAVAVEAKLQPNTPVGLAVDHGNLLVTPLPELTVLEALLARVTDENLHGEMDTGPSVGRETW